MLAPGDVILADRLTANWANIVFLRERGLELVSRLNKAHRVADWALVSGVGLLILDLVVFDTAATAVRGWGLISAWP